MTIWIKVSKKVAWNFFELENIFLIFYLFGMVLMVVCFVGVKMKKTKDFLVVWCWRSMVLYSIEIWIQLKFFLHNCLKLVDLDFDWFGIFCLICLEFLMVLFFVHFFKKGTICTLFCVFQNVTIGLNVWEVSKLFIPNPP